MAAFKYTVGCFEIFSFKRPLSANEWKEIQSLLNAEKWDFVGRKLFPIDDIKFYFGSKDLEQLQQIFNSVEAKIGDLSVRGEILLVDNYDRNGCKLIKAKPSKDKKIEVILYEMGYRTDGYFDWDIATEDHHAIPPPEEDEEPDIMVSTLKMD